MAVTQNLGWTQPYHYRLPRRHLFLIIALYRHATKIYAGHSRRCEIHRYGTRYIVYYLYHNTYRLSYQNENASLGNTCGRTRLTLTFWPVYIRSFTKKEFTGKCK
jgi:hypothetical protein